MIKETKCPDCGSILKSCCIRHVLAGMPAPESSRLQGLLYKSAYGAGLTINEWNEARYLINHPKFSEERCRACTDLIKARAIFDTGLCQEHAFKALEERK